MEEDAKLVVIARDAYIELYLHLNNDDPSPLPDDENLKRAEGYAMIVGDTQVESLARNVRKVRERERSEKAAAEREA